MAQDAATQETSPVSIYLVLSSAGQLSLRILVPLFIMSLVSSMELLGDWQVSLSF